MHGCVRAWVRVCQSGCVFYIPLPRCNRDVVGSALERTARCLLLGQQGSKVKKKYILIAKCAKHTAEDGTFCRELTVKQDFETFQVFLSSNWFECRKVHASRIFPELRVAKRDKIAIAGHLSPPSDHPAKSLRYNNEQNKEEGGEREA